MSIDAGEKQKEPLENRGSFGAGMPGVYKRPKKVYKQDIKNY